MIMRILTTLLALFALAGVWAYAHELRPTLPAEIPIHFDSAGHPNRMAPADEIYSLPMMDTFATGIILFLSCLMGPMARRIPGLINVPRKAEFVALTPEARARALGPAATVVPLIAVLSSGIFGYVLWGTGEVALKHRETFSAAPLAVAVPLVIACPILIAVGVARAIRRESRPKGV
jgi:hypothetical protein